MLKLQVRSSIFFSIFFKFYKIRPAATLVMFERKTVFWKHVPNIRNINMFINGKYFLLSASFHLFLIVLARKKRFSKSPTRQGSTWCKDQKNKSSEEKGETEIYYVTVRWINCKKHINFTSTQVRSHSLLKLRTPSPSLLAQVNKNNKMMPQTTNIFQE